MNCETCGARMNFHQLSGVYACPDCGRVVIPDDVTQTMSEASAVEACKMALAFYADAANYQAPFAILGDGGQMAQAALAMLEG